MVTIEVVISNSGLISNWVSSQQPWFIRVDSLVSGLTYDGTIAESWLSSKWPYLRWDYLLELAL